jgi:hypothetical protein
VPSAATPEATATAWQTTRAGGHRFSPKASVGRLPGGRRPQHDLVPLILPGDVTLPDEPDVLGGIPAGLGADRVPQGHRVSREARALGGEILVYVLPVLPGDGIRFYSSPGHARIDLEPLDSTRSGAVTILRFRVRK